MNEPILVTSALSKSYHASRGLFLSQIRIQALENISFSLSNAETLAVVGETGSGKTTLARILSGLEQHDEGMILLKGKEFENSKHNVKKINQSIRLIFQNPGRTLNPKQQIKNILLQPLKSMKSVPEHEYESRLLDIMKRVGLTIDQGNWYPHMFSGGHQQRIAIARALIARPEVVIADEPFSALDVSVQAQVTNLLLDLQQQIGISYIFISHNLGIVKHISDKILVMFAGQMIEFGYTQDIFKKPQHPYTRTLLASIPGLGSMYPRKWIATGKIATKTVTQEIGCPYAYRCQHANEQCAFEKPSQKLVDKQLVTCHLAGEI